MNKRTHAAVLCSLATLPFLTSVPARAEGSVIEILQNARNSVVTVRCKLDGLTGQGTAKFFDPKSGRVFTARRFANASYVAEGAGVVIDNSGIIAASAHMIQPKGRLEVTLQSGETLETRLLENFPQDDIALIQIGTAKSPPALPFADSDAVRLGDKCYAIGGSEVLKNTLSQGKITGIGEKKVQLKGKDGTLDLLQAGFNVYKGDSGSPLLDKDGRLLGIISARQPKVGKVSYAVPSNRVREKYEEYLKKIAG